jgi:predicted oxidoreductase
MTHLSLIPDGPSFSRIVFGTWRLFDRPEASTPEGLLSILKTALDHGITTIDTAEIYGLYRVEELIGQALALDAGVKKKVQLITKCGIYVPCASAPGRQTAHYDSRAERLKASAERSLQLLGVETLDLLLVHRPDWLTPHEETAAGLNDLLASGKVRSVGVSNYLPSQFEALQHFVDAPLVTNQVEFSPLCMTPITDGTFDQCQRLGVHPMAWSPTGGGRLFKADDTAGARFRTACAGMAERYAGATVDQLAYAWILAHPSQPIVVMGTTVPERIASGAKGDEIQLAHEDWYALWEAAQGRRIP